MAIIKQHQIACLALGIFGMTQEINRVKAANTRHLSTRFSAVISGSLRIDFQNLYTSIYLDALELSENQRNHNFKQSIAILEAKLFECFFKITSHDIEIIPICKSR